MEFILQVNISLAALRFKGNVTGVAAGVIRSLEACEQGYVFDWR